MSTEMNLTAAQILDHCKAVCEGRIPQPELLRVEVEDFFCRIYYKGTMHVVWGFNLASTESELQIAARILGLDRPAPVVELAWKKTEKIRYNHTTYDAVYSVAITAHVGQYNDSPNANAQIHIVKAGTINMITDGEPCTLDKAQQWCIDMITAIITPKP